MASTKTVEYRTTRPVFFFPKIDTGSKVCSGTPKQLYVGCPIEVMGEFASNGKTLALVRNAEGDPIYWGWIHDHETKRA